MAGQIIPNSSSSSSSSSLPMTTTTNHNLSIKLTSRNFLTWKTQFQTLLNYYKLTDFIDGSIVASPTSLFPNNQKPSFSFRRNRSQQCQICGFHNHTADRCRRRYEPRNQVSSPQAHYANNTGLISSYGFGTSSPPYTAAFHPNPWHPDTGASHHMTADPSHIVNPIPYAGNDKIIVGNGQTLPITHTGKSFHRSPYFHKDLIFKNVLHVP